MSAWNHRLYSVFNIDPAAGNARCSGGLCKEPVVFLAQYDYITGRAGRISQADRWLCERHGMAFAAKHHALVKGQVDQVKYFGERQTAFQQLLAIDQGAGASAQKASVA